MPSMRWFPLVPIEKACHTRKLYAGSSKPVAPSLTPLSSVPSSPSRKQKCPPYSPPLAPPSLQPCSHTGVWAKTLSSRIHRKTTAQEFILYRSLDQLVTQAAVLQ